MVNEYRLCVMGDLNGWVGDRVREGNWCMGVEVRMNIEGEK